MVRKPVVDGERVRRGHCRGPGAACFPEGVFVPDYAESIYNRDAKAETGQLIEWSGIGNALIRRDRCLTATDAIRIHDLGCPGARTSCFFSVTCASKAGDASGARRARSAKPSRRKSLRPAYLLRRAFRGGQTTAYLPSTLARPQWSLVLRWMAIVAAQV